MPHCCKFEEKLKIMRKIWSWEPKFSSRKQDVQDNDVLDNEITLREMSTKWPKVQGICLRYQQD